MKNIEEIVIAALGAALPVPVSADVPKDRPESFVTVELTGGGKAGPSVDSATLAVQSWAQGRHGAAELSCEADAAMLDIPLGSSVVSKVARAGRYNFPDPDGKSARYQGVYDITYHNDY
jgi:hypothetical protein